MTYEQNIREIAAQIACKKYTDYHERSSRMRLKYVEMEMFCASITIKLQAKAFAEGWAKGKDYCECEGEFVRNMESEMLLLGLIDDTKCMVCDKSFMVDGTGKYCNNRDCTEFWKK
jgi:hypothetical protein